VLASRLQQQGAMSRAREIIAFLGCVLLAGCSLSHPHYVAPDVHVGQPAFERTLEAHTLSTRVDGNSAQLLLNGDQIFPAMLAAIRGARHTITFANFIFEEGDSARDMVSALAERCREFEVTSCSTRSAPARCPRSTGIPCRTPAAALPGFTR
jgi:hypothetical protein